MTTLSPPSIQPTDLNSLSGSLKFALDKHGQNTDDMLPAQIIAYDRATNLASVQPLIFVVTSGNTLVNRPQIYSVPVVQIGGGGFVLNFPIKAGDLGWIKSNDRDISLFKQSWAASAPNTYRTHDFGDAIFIPSILTGFVISGEDAENCVLQNLAGTVKISLGTNTITMTAATVAINGALTVTGDVTAGYGSANISLIPHIHSASGGTGNGGPPVNNT